MSVENVRALIGLSAEDIERMSSSLYNVRVQGMKGESSMVVRGVGSANSIEAWKRIRHMYTQSTPAAALTDLMWVMSPGKGEE